ncbi:hypothetical protein GQ53DRAFT_159770 [Thozetella sp. PMI_491]|nr:hypothetical protein GQ53DRAFT_159770 [Thozetella sp. PMI_491]
MSRPGPKAGENSRRTNARVAEGLWKGEAVSARCFPGIPAALATFHPWRAIKSGHTITVPKLGLEPKETEVSKGENGAEQEHVASQAQTADSQPKSSVCRWPRGRLAASREQLAFSRTQTAALLLLWEQAVDLSLPRRPLSAREVEGGRDSPTGLGPAFRFSPTADSLLPPPTAQISQPPWKRQAGRYQANLMKAIMSLSSKAWSHSRLRKMSDSQALA